PPTAPQDHPATWIFRRPAFRDGAPRTSRRDDRARPPHPIQGDSSMDRRDFMKQTATAGARALPPGGAPRHLPYPRPPGPDGAAQGPTSGSDSPASASAARGTATRATPPGTATSSASATSTTPRSTRWPIG